MRRSVLAVVLGLYAVHCQGQTEKIPDIHANTLMAPNQFREIPLTSQLPESIAKLCADPDGLLADPGKKWEAGCTVDGKTPTSRLIWAVTNGEYFVVHYEQGGFALSLLVLVARVTPNAKLDVIWDRVQVNERLKNYQSFVDEYVAPNVLAQKVGLGQIDPWYTDCPESRRPQDEFQVSHDQIVEVTAATMPEAELLLKDVPAIEISETQAAELTGKRIAATKGNRLFLVRGVYWNADTGGFWVSHVDNNLFVAHSSLGGADAMGRRALVVPLPALPTAVYVWCSTAR